MNENAAKFPDANRLNNSCDSRSINTERDMVFYQQEAKIAMSTEVNSGATHFDLVNGGSDSRCRPLLSNITSSGIFELHCKHRKEARAFLHWSPYVESAQWIMQRIHQLESLQRSFASGKYWEEQA